ncbi:MAG: hypothetical protein ACEQSL_00830, partial [Sediminibacterium sp.]
MGNIFLKQGRVIFLPMSLVLFFSVSLISCRENGPECIIAPECRGDSALRFAVIGDWGWWGQADQ